MPGMVQMHQRKSRSQKPKSAVDNIKMSNQSPGLKSTRKITARKYIEKEPKVFKAKEVPSSLYEEPKELS